MTAFPAIDSGRAWVLPVLVWACLGGGALASDHGLDRQRHAARTALDSLRVWETARRASADFASMPSGERVTGADPWAIVSVDAGRDVILLRGAARLWLTDPSGRRLGSAPGPPVGSGLAIHGSWMVAVGEALGEVWCYRIAHRRVTLARRQVVVGHTGFRDVVFSGDRRLFLIDGTAGRLISAVFDTTDATVHVEKDQPVGREPHQLALAGDCLLVNLLSEHAVDIYPLGNSGEVPAAPVVSVTHDGPIWSMAARAATGGLELVLAGVEDRPLDRSSGFFGSIDSYLYVYDIELAANQGRATRRAAHNLSQHHLVTPKVLRYDPRTAEPSLFVAAYGGARGAVISGLAGPALGVRSFELPAGSRSAVPAGPAGWRLANPLADAWVAIDSAGADWRLIALSDPMFSKDGVVERTTTRRLGEILLYTELMAPLNATGGRRSRFSCETCHFEGYGDGRLHFTGRPGVYASTKPLRGLFNNNPYFSRALDPDLTTMVHAEFRVAGAANGRSPWFALAADDHRWLAKVLGGQERVWSPVALRGAVMEFLMASTHLPNPHAHGRTEYNALEAEGALLFRRACAGCHAPRWVTNDVATTVAFDDWEAAIFKNGALVFASEEYARTGAVPAVHPAGARVPSLRRIYRKTPLLVGGGASNLAALVARSRWRDDGGFSHVPVAGDGWQVWTAGEAKALVAFLELL